MSERKVIPLAEYEERAWWWDEIFPRMEFKAGLDKTFYTPGKRSLKELLEFQARILSDLELVWSKLPEQRKDRFVEKCAFYWKDIRELEEKCRALVREILAEKEEGK